MHRIKRFLSQILPFVVAVDLLPLGSAQAAAIAPPPPNAVVVPEAADPDPNAGLAPVRIAVLDTGIDANHPDLKGKVAGWQSFTGGNPLTDPNGHGTALASIALPREDARPASLLSVQVLGPDGHAQDAAVVAGVRWAADNGASVILMGFSSPEYSPALAGAIAYAWGKGAVLLAAAGNDGSASPRFPAAMEHVIGVAATDGAGHLLALSNTGSATVAALGANVAAAAPGGGYRAFSGTSASAAEGAELAARLVSAGYTREQVANQIVAAGDSIDGQALRRLNPGNALGRLAAPLAIVKPAAQPSAGSPIYEANGTGTTQTFVSCSGGGGSPPTWTCTATVFGLSPFGTPTGTVSFSLGSGNFSANPNPCTLSSGSCSTTVTHNTGGNTTTLTGT
ncbi:MAG TPA: S8 family serine peptidase, partial [Gemmataceae bacterium]|nr:S8 family serine peptidase [Gemmataceae bacterium]